MYFSFVSKNSHYNVNKYMTTVIAAPADGGTATRRQNDAAARDQRAAMTPRLSG